jgi:hypothetical protein
LRKLDLFDLGVLLVICATDGIDMVNEEYVQSIDRQLTQKCCLAHAVQKVNPETLEPNLRSTLLVLRRIFSRLSPEATDFICFLMQQRFSD